MAALSAGLLAMHSLCLLRKMQIEKQKKMAVEKQNRMAVEEQNKMAFEEQNKMVVEEQNKMAVEEQNKTAVEEQNKMVVEKQNKMAVEKHNKMAIEKQNKMEIEEQNKMAFNEQKKMAIEEQKKMAIKKQKHRRQRRARLYRTRVKLQDMSDHQVIQLYRLDRQTIFTLLEELEPELSAKISISTAVPPLVKLLSVLHFCASGSFQGTVAAANGLSQPAFSSILEQVVNSMIKRVKDHVYFPKTSTAIGATKAGLYAISHFPNVVGCLDCTHVTLVPPKMQERVFRNGKGQYSVNVQAVCDSDLLFTHCCARFPGSTHDSFILRSSSLPSLMKSLDCGTSWLLGDEGYPLKPWLLTPFRNPNGPSENKYQDAHIKTRNCIERAFGQLKSRFRCLHGTGDNLQYKPEKVCGIIIMCVMFHNIAIRKQTPLPDDCNIATAPQHDTVDYTDEEDHEEGTKLRCQVVNNFFNEL